MTDQRFIEVIISRVHKALGLKPNAKTYIVVYSNGRNMYFGVNTCLNDPYNYTAIPIFFRDNRPNGLSCIFKIKDSSPSIVEWKKTTAAKMAAGHKSWERFDIKDVPQEVAHLFIHAIIEALNTDGMSVICAIHNPDGDGVIFAGNENYETISIEADMLDF